MDVASGVKLTNRNDGRCPARYTTNLENGILNKVNDYKYLGSWLENSEHDFKIRKQSAWTAIFKLFRIWKSIHINREIKFKLFRATLESILLYYAT